MKQNFDAVRSFVIREERGYSDDSRDDGNWSGGRAGVGVLIGSNEGVSAPAADAFMHRIMTARWMRALPDSVQRAIFLAFWNRVAGDVLPTGIDLMLIDSAWNRGPGTAVQILQRVLSLAADGKPGPKTIAAASHAQGISISAMLVDVVAFQKALGVIEDGELGPHTREAFAQLPAGEALMVALYAAQVRDYRRLDNFEIYGDGWLARTWRRFSTARAMVPWTAVA